METLTAKHISPFAIPGMGEQINELMDRIKLTTPILVKKDEFKEMWPIFKRVCKVYEEDPEKIYWQNGRRERPAVEIRQISMALFRKELPECPQRICALFFGLDHATTIHAVKTVKNLRETNRHFREKTDELFKK